MVSPARRISFIVAIVTVLWTPTLLTTTPDPVMAQSSTTETSARKLERFRVAAGVGNHLGGFGLEAELFVLDSRLSLLGGAGFMGGLNGAAAVRSYFLARQHHGAFVSVGISPLSAEQDCLVRQEPTVGGDCGPIAVPYGPGVAAGYRFEVDRGFSVEAVIGGGWVERVKPHSGIEKGDVYPLFGLTVGYGF